MIESRVVYVFADEKETIRTETHQFFGSLQFETEEIYANYCLFFGWGGIADAILVILAEIKRNGFAIYADLKFDHLSSHNVQDLVAHVVLRLKIFRIIFGDFNIIGLEFFWTFIINTEPVNFSFVLHFVENFLVFGLKKCVRILVSSSH